MREIQIHALIISRNGASTLDALLGHLHDNAIDATLVDHASTDGTWEVAEKWVGSGLKGLLREPYVGAFDLTRQLDLRSDLIRSTRCDWILNLDDDEFLVPSDAEGTLRTAIERAHADGAQVVEAEEFVFVPETADIRYSPETFREEMRHYVPFRPHNPKQRAFRPDVDLTLWRRTGGHTVTRDEDAIAGERLHMLHYPALSLDEVRAKYLSRVFAVQDLKKGWHTNRTGGEADFVRAPEAAALRNVDRDGLERGGTVSELPYFSSPQIPGPTRLHAPDLVVAAPPGGGAEEVAAALSQAFPEKGIVPVSRGYGDIPDVDCPLVVVLRDPRVAVGLLSSGDERTSIAQWVRRMCHLLQISLAKPGTLQVRFEDLQADFSTLCSDLEKRFGETASRIPEPLTRDPAAEKTALARWRAASANGGPEVIAGPVLLDLGYGPSDHA